MMFREIIAVYSDNHTKSIKITDQFSQKKRHQNIFFDYKCFGTTCEICHIKKYVLGILKFNIVIVLLRVYCNLYTGAIQN
jgi:hypothetical protein